MFAFWVCVDVKGASPHLPFWMYPTEDVSFCGPKSHHLERRCKRWQKRHRIPQEHSTFQQSERFNSCVPLLRLTCCSHWCLCRYLLVVLFTCQAVHSSSQWLIGRNVYGQVGIGPGSVCTTRKQTGLEGRTDPSFLSNFDVPPVMRPSCDDICIYYVHTRYSMS